MAESTRWPGCARTAAILAAVFVLVFTRAMTRPLDPDEHQFVAPAVLMSTQGLRPYLDFPLFHMPLLEYLYAWVLGPSTHALMVTRTFSALVGTLTAGLLFLASYRWLGPPGGGGAGGVDSKGLPEWARWMGAGSVLILFLGARVFTYTNGWSWNHDASTLALLGAVLLHLWAVRTGRVWALLGVGFLLGAAMSIRLTTAPAAAALGLAGLVLPSGLSPGNRIAGAGLAVCGCLVALAPTINLYLRAPEEFMFGNLGYPLLYRQYVMGNNSQHTTVLGKIGHTLQTWLGDPGNAAVLVLLVAAMVRSYITGVWRGRGGAEVLTLLMVCAGLWVGAAAPYQMQIQYHSALLPFALLTVVAVMARDTGRHTVTRAWVHGAGIAAAVVLLVNFPRWYWQVGDLARPGEWTPMQVHATGEWLRSVVPGNGPVLTIDPIVPLEAGMRVYPQLATGRFTFHVGKFMTEAERVKHGIAYGRQLGALMEREPPAAIMYNWRMERAAPELGLMGAQMGFERLESPDGEFVVWVRTGDGR